MSFSSIIYLLFDDYIFVGRGILDAPFLIVFAQRAVRDAGPYAR
jgi:hypothetical protein